MANKDDYLTSYRKFFEYFAQTVNPNDQLPVKLGSYKLLNVEVIGGIIDWTSQYLSQKKCPPHLFSPIIKIIIEEIRKACKKHPLMYGFNSTDNAYEPLKLMQAVMAKTNEVCLRYLDNSMLCSLPAPSNTYYETSVSAMRNRRRKMEDRHVAIHDLNTMFNIQEASPSSYYAIFDGHAGHDAAAYSAAHLHQFLAENKYFISNPEQALLDAFCKTDALFLEKCKVESLNGGTTAVVALLRPKEKTLYIAWVGDSQALLVNQGKVLQCVNPHKPSREDERERIEKAGGCVMLWGTWRVNGQLAVSRAIGDADYKPHVIAIPDVREIPLDGGEDFLIIACDGLWDYLTEDAAAQEVYYMIAENPDDTERVSKYLVHRARYQGSTDNISVIVVFLREPHQIAAEAHRWATRTGPKLATNNMDTGLDNVNNPFTNSNGSLKNLDLDSDNINLQKSNDGLLLNLTDNFKAKGADISQDIFVTEKSNGTKMSASDIHFDDDFGPETDVDAVDDAFSPVDKDKAFSESLSKVLKDEGIPKSFNDEMKAFTDGLANNNPLDDEFNPFLNNQNKESAKSGTEDSREIDFEEFRGTNREETPTPPADAVHDVGGLEVNPTESDSEDEWNYIKGDQAKPENLPSQPETVVETSEQDDAMSQLNPNAAEFVPVSPTRSIPSPACRALINDEVISQSPKRPVRVDINVPSETEFESEVKSRPSDFDYKNGHDSDDEHNKSGILNGKNIEEILEFQPGSTPAKVPIEELYFGPNAVPFTPRALDQSEAFSTKANYGDDTEHTINTSFNDSELAVPNKEQTDPMSMSFYAEKGETNPFQDDEDLNKVHELPENLDAFLQEVDDIKENVHFNETISDLPEHDPLGIPLDNDQAAIQTTDLDKISQDDEKELASPLEDHDDMLNINPSVDVPSNDPWKSSESNLLDEFVVVSEKLQLDDSNVALLPELEPISGPPSEQVPKAPSPQLNLVALELEEDSPTSPAPLDSSSPIPEGELDLLQSQSPLATKTDLVHLEELSNDHLVETTVADHLNVVQFNHSDDTVETQNPAYDIRFETKSPKTDFEEPSSDNLVGASEPAHLDIDQFSHSEGRSEPQSPACELAPESKSPVIGLEEPTSPVCEFKVGSETVEAEFDPKSEVENIHLENKDHILENLAASPVPACEYSAELGSCEFAPQNLESQSPIDSLPDHKQEEDVTSSIKDDVSSPIEELSPIKSPESLVDASIKAAEPALEDIESTKEQHEDIVKTEPQEIPSPEILSGFSCLPVSEPLIQQQVETSEINVLEVSAVVEPTGLSNGFDNFASEFNEQVCVKTDNITPEFAEPAIISPSEESKAIDDVIILTPVTNDADVPIEKIPIEPPSEENKVTDEIVALSPVTTDADTSIKHLGETLSQEMKDIVSLSPVTINADAPIETTQIEPPLEKSKAIDEVIASSLVTTLADIPVERSQIEPIASELHSFISQAEPHIPQIEEPKPIDTLTETPKEIPILTPLPVIPVTPLESKEVKEDEKKASTPALGKKPIGKLDAKKSAATPKVGAPKASPKPAASSPKTGVAPKVLSKIGTAKPAGTAPRTTSTGTSKPLPKPKTATAPKTTEKKPSADLKPAPRTTLAKKPATETLTTRTITRPASTGAKTSPTKTTTPRPTTAPRTSLPKTTSTSLPKTTSSIPPKPTAAAKPRVSLTSRTTTITAASKTTTATSAKTTTTTATRTVSSPKTATAPPKPRTITSTAPKPRVPLSKTVTKSADVEKEKKESANKLTASRSTTVTKTTSGIAGSRTTTTVKKTEIKPSSDRTVSSKTTTSTTRTTTLTKKPGDIKTSSKTKTTKVEKPKQNGIAPTNVTEEIKEITIINDVVNGSESDNLVKDNSPLDNKLIIETSNALIDMNPAD